MIDPRSVAFDFDGVVADTMNLFIKVARSIHRIDHLKYEDFTCYKLLDCIDIDPDTLTDIIDRLQDGRYTDPLEPMAGAADVLQRLGERYGPLVFITARPHSKPVDDWLQQLLSLDPGMLNVVPTGSFDVKADELTRRGIRYFVEDRLETCYEVEKVGVVPVLYRQPWNRNPHPFMEVGNWYDLEAIIEF